MEPGLYLTFFSQGEAAAGELPPVGPLEHVVVRQASLLADRMDGAIGPQGTGSRWIEAERELRRATGEEPGGVTRPHLRISAPEGVYLRFVSFDDVAEHDRVPELGPYAVVVVGRDEVEADGDPLATRAGPARNLWELTGVGASALVGVIRPDIAFRTRSTSYHAEVKPFRLGAPEALSSAGAPADTTQTRPTEDTGLTLRDRIGSERASPVTPAVVEADTREWGGAAWDLRYFIIGALVVLVAVFSVPSIRELANGGNPEAATVSAGTNLTAPGWTYNVGTVRRVATIGAARPRGTYLVVQVVVTNRGTAGARLEPSNFILTAAGGEQYAAESASSVAYSGSLNPDSPYEWPAEFPVGRAVAVPLIFAVNPAVAGTQLAILDVPGTRVRLE